MTEKSITLHGKQYPVVFDLQTIINFEEITGNSIFADNLSSMKSRIALVTAAVLSASPKSDITLDTIMGNKDWQSAQQVISAYIVIDGLASEFFKVPAIEQKAEKDEAASQDEDSGDGKKKN